MHRLSSIIFLLGLTIHLYAQNPHGVDFKTDCSTCHTSSGWEITPDFWIKNDPASPRISTTTGLKLPGKTKGFDHSQTDFTLQGQHTRVDCRACHETLVFSQAQTECVSCHTDMHNQTVGMDCARCHTPENWLVNNITEIHYDNGFPLLGAHNMANCFDCHQSASNLSFDRIGNDCVNCHLDEYAATTQPNHREAGFSTDCFECHDVNMLDWSTKNINHDFFPLTLGHEITDCAQCHSSGDYSSISGDCFSCHQPDYSAATNPNHQQQHFPTDCRECHTLDPGWSPAQFTTHDVQYFPIYSGSHNGEWDQCIDCHTTSSNYSVFSCTVCHVNPETNDHHAGIGGYSYDSQACLACHPTGNADDNFNHNLTDFPLTGAHISTECAECHSQGYAGTSAECVSCHTPDYNQAVNPNHTMLGLSTNCAACHTTEPEWNPAKFAVHNDYYVLQGAHAAIANDCATCHNGDYTNTPNTCVGCHLADYNATTEPNHKSLQFSTDCASCHAENAWEPATFNHDQTDFPLTGAHTTTDCMECHAQGYAGTPTDCASCHTPDYNQTTNPNHTALGFSTNCASCHTTHPDWSPATFNHNDYYVLNGAHAAIANDCAACHAGDYSNTPNTCAGCHLDDYNRATDPNHITAQFPTDCASCHSENAWEPSTFDHDGQYFPIYSGRHQGEWDQCIDCHTSPSNFAVFSCIDCHAHSNRSEVDNHHSEVRDYTYTSQACLSCHPTGRND